MTDENRRFTLRTGVLSVNGIFHQSRWDYAVRSASAHLVRWIRQHNG